jgi:TolB-like protein
MQTLTSIHFRGILMKTHSPSTRKTMKAKFIFFITGMTLLCSVQGVFAESFKKIAKKLSSASFELSNKKIAVLPFPYHDGRTSQGSTIVSERLTTKLVEHGKLQVIERSLMEKVLKELELQSSGAIDEQSAKKLGKILGVEAIVTGTLIPLNGDKVEVNARLIKVETGQILVATSQKIKYFWNETPPYAAPTPPPSQPKTTASAPIQNEVDPDCDTCVKESEEFAPSLDQPPLSLSDANTQRRYASNREWDKNYRDAPEFAEIILKEADLPSNMMNSPLGHAIAEGFHFLRQNRLMLAQEHFETLLHEPTVQRHAKAHAIIQIGYAISLFEQGQTGQARSQVRKMAEATDHPRIQALAHFVLGRFDEESGQAQKAKDHYLETIRLTPYQTPLSLEAGRKAQTFDRHPKRRPPPRRRPPPHQREHRRYP